jgi:hypothetical protein
MNGLDGGVGKVDVVVSGLNSGGKDVGDIDVSGSGSGWCTRPGSGFRVGSAPGTKRIRWQEVDDDDEQQQRRSHDEIYANQSFDLGSFLSGP